MRMINPSLVITIAALWAFQVHAAPDASGDSTDPSLASKHFLTQVDEVRQSVTHKASELVVNAMGFIGVPYQWGGTSAETGFDCSGFVRSVYQQSIGLLLPRKAEEQASATHAIDKHELQPGDLVFFNTMRRTFSHVGIYVGEGRFIHSPRAGGQVRLENMGQSYWQTRFDGARRVLAAASVQSAPLVSLASLASDTAARVFKTPALKPQVLRSAQVSKRKVNVQETKKHEAKKHEAKKHEAKKQQPEKQAAKKRVSTSASKMLAQKNFPAKKRVRA